MTLGADHEEVQAYVAEIESLRAACRDVWRRAQHASAMELRKFKDLRKRDQFDEADCHTPYEPPPRPGTP